MRDPNIECSECGTKFYKKPSRIKRDKTHSCSTDCLRILQSKRMTGKGNHQFGLRGELNGSFKKDWRISSYGYILIRDTNHPFRMGDDFIFSHRLVLEEYLKRNSPNSEYLVVVDNEKYLSPDVVVHHKDGNRMNNSISNLQPMYLGDHVSYHNHDLIIERDSDGTFRSVAKLQVTKPISKQNPTDAGYDVRSDDNYIIAARSSALINTGLKVNIPASCVGLLWSRSGLSVKNKIEVGAGCIDSGYKGEIIVHLYNHGDENFKISKGDRIAQLLIVTLNTNGTHEVTCLPESTRGTGGFGSSGVR